MPKWGVLVVHGVGDTGPGVTVDTLLGSLTAGGANLRPDGVARVHWFPDRAAPGATTPPDMFPVHVRRAAVPAAPAGTPTAAVFAEVYWADLSRIREGTLHLLYGLLSIIFFLRFIPDWAAYLPGRPARWVRWLLHGAAWWLCGPIAALNAVAAVLFAGYFWVVHPLTPWVEGRLPDAATDPRTTSGQVGIGLLCFAAAVVAGVSAGWCRRTGAGSTWTRFWYAAAAIAGGLTAAVGLTSPASWTGFVPHELTASVADAPAPELYPVAVLFGLIFLTRVSFVVLGVYLLGLVGPVWVWAWAATWRAGGGGPKARSALAAALGAMFLQVGLWLLIVPPVVLLGARHLLPESVRGEVEALFFPRIKWSLTVHLAATLVIALAALVVGWRRGQWVKAFAAGRASPPGPAIPRLVVNALILAAIILVAYAASGLFLFEAAGGRPPAGFSAKLAEAVTALILAGVTVGGALLATGLRSWLHILMDVINHFYRRHEPIPVPWKMPTVDVREFEIQQAIEHRFRAALDFLLKEPGVTHLTVVAHSQGTVIAIDVLSLVGLKRGYRVWLTKRLGKLKQFALVTMGSPITHLYQHYFPLRYPSFGHGAWTNFKTVVRRWVNIYRADDFIGTDVETVPGATWAGSPVNVQIGPGGHTGYWRQDDVHRLLLGRPVAPPIVPPPGGALLPG